jgi:16S rRNA (uracil1498-N3)-methyltransferase
VENLAGARAAGDEVAITGEAAHHLSRVVRVREGEVVVLFDGRGHEIPARVARVEGGRRQLQVVVTAEGPARLGVQADAAAVCLLQGYPKGDKLDIVARQIAELGARALWPVYTARSVPQPGRGEETRRERLAAIAASASAQCGRADVMAVAAPRALEEALADLDPAVTLRLVAWEEGGEPLGQVLARAAPEGGCAVLVGPEGGLTTGEVELAGRHGFVPVSLGPRILRTETAGPALVAMLALARGDLHPQRG